jgi:hypothetical protein
MSSSNRGAWTVGGEMPFMDSMAEYATALAVIFILESIKFVV